jgi:pimeloyl-ACP methyl ester carboxylesterase
MTATGTSSAVIADSCDYTVDLTDGRKLGYAIYGERSSSYSHTVIYMHGVPASRKEGAFWHSAALQAGVRLVCPDRPGIGLSSTRLGGWTLLDFADDCTRLLRSLNVKEVSILGYSGGGPSAMALGYRLSCPSVEKEGMTTRIELRSIGLVAAMGPYHLAIDHLGLMQRDVCQRNDGGFLWTWRHQGRHVGYAAPHQRLGIRSR